MLISKFKFFFHTVEKQDYKQIYSILIQFFKIFIWVSNEYNFNDNDSGPWGGGGNNQIPGKDLRIL